MKNVIVYGLGERFQLFQIWEYELKPEYNIIGVSDKFKPSKDMAYMYIERENIVNVKFDVIIVTSDKYFYEIEEDLMQEGIDKKSIVSLQSIIDGIHKEVFLIDEFVGKKGVEIGGPTYIFKNTIYQVCGGCDNIIFSSNTMWGEATNKAWNEYANKYLGDVLIADVTYMNSIQNEVYDFCISSNNLEHTANPMRAISESLRVIKSGGILLIIVPFKGMCFDHNREYSSFEHVLKDYRNNVQEDDLSHLEEILDKHDFELDPGCETVEQFKIRAMNNINNRCLHHHVFDDQLLIDMFQFFNIDILRNGIIGPNIYIIGKKK